MRKLTQLIIEDMRPALGVTEPGAIAFAVATAKEHVRGELQQIKLVLNSGMYKNAFTCGIPNSYEQGNEYAAALGYVAATASRGLECLDSAKLSDSRRAKEIVRTGRVKVLIGEISSRIYIHAEITTSEGQASVTIKDAHTNITQITENGKIVYSAGKTSHSNTSTDTKPLIHRYTLRKLLHYVETVPVEEIQVVRNAYDVNLALFHQALESKRTPFTRYLIEKNDGKIISENEQLTASLLCNAAIEARVLGFSHPAMSITGSGAHGIIATLPLYGSQQINHYSDEQLLRATALSYLICMYIKEYSGRLSAFCGCAIAAGTGMACALAWMKGGRYKELSLVIRNMASSITGMICDGGNHGCTLKGIVAVDAAYHAVDMALSGVAIDSRHGINGKTPEETMRNMGLIASPGMLQTENVIMDILQRK